MRKLILKMSLSVDGFASDRDGKNAWVSRSGDSDAAAWTIDVLTTCGVHIMGSGAFVEMGAFWASSTSKFAPVMNELPKVVFSRRGMPELGPPPGTDKPPDQTAKAYATWTSARVAPGSLVDEIDALKRQDGKPIVAHGGVRFARSLVEADLVDDYYLMIHPVILGQGGSPFSGARSQRDLKLVDVKQFSAGTIGQIFSKA